MQLNIAVLRHTVVSGLFLALSAGPAFAYTGPGLGLGAIGSALGVVAALLLMLLSIVWYPMKRLLRRMRGEKATQRTGRKSS